MTLREHAATMPSNYMQRVYDVLASTTRGLSIYLIADLATMSRSSTRMALDGLISRKLVIGEGTTRERRYRIVAGASRPVDGRGHRRKKEGGTLVAA